MSTSSNVFEDMAAILEGVLIARASYDLRPEPFIVADPLGRIIRANAAADQLFETKLSGRLLTELMDRKTAVAHEAGMKRFLQGDLEETEYFREPHTYSALRPETGEVIRITMRGIRRFDVPGGNGEPRPLLIAWIQEAAAP